MAVANISEFGLIHWEYENPQQISAFWFEKVDANELRYWAKKYTVTISAIIFIPYFSFIWLGPKWMKNREAFKLEKPLAAWNFFLSFYNLLTVMRVAPELLRIVMSDEGLYKSACLLEVFNYPTTFWGFLFVLLKIIELGDTVFIVLRKKPIMHLHWFHHFNMIWISFFMFAEGEPFLRWICFGIASIHTVMYFYYGLKALQIKIPNKVAMMITAFQIMQFVFMLIGQYFQFVHYIGAGRPCIRTRNSVIVTTTFGVIYLILFIRLFYVSHIIRYKPKTA